MDFIEESFKMRTIKREEIVNYFVKIGGHEKEDGTLAGEGWETEIGQETPAFLGSFLLPEIKITIRGRKDIFDKLYADFKLAFLRGGG
jgi:hypothetical protein